MIARKPRRDEPQGFSEIQDHNSGVSFLRNQRPYLADQSARAKRYFRDLVRNEQVAQLVKEVGEAERRWSTTRDADRKDFDRPQEIKSWAFAQRLTREMGFSPSASRTLH